MHSHNFPNIAFYAQNPCSRADNLGVSGTRNGISVTLTCIGTGGNSPAMAVVIVVGDTDQPTHQLHNDLVGFITKVGCIDSPC